MADSTRRLKSQFLHAARLGLGRAYLLAQVHPEVDFSAAIIEVAIRNFAYHPQSEGSRAGYAFGLYELAGRPARIRQAILRALATEPADNTWNLVQLFELALLLARQGHARAKAAIYRRFRQMARSGAGWAGHRQILVLDGLAGLGYVARWLGRALLRNPGGWYDDDLLNDFHAQYPDVDGWAALRQLAGADADVRRYLAAVDDTLALREKTTRPAPAGALGLDELLRYPLRAIRRRLLHRPLTPAEVRELAGRLAAARHHAEREKLLAVFAVVPFPLDYQLLLTLAAQRTGRHRPAARAALDALAQLRGPEIRQLALASLPAAHRPDYYTDLLIRNYQPGDAALLTRQVERCHGELAIEQLLRSYLLIYRANSTPECAGPLLALYHKSTCGVHRRDVVQLLIDNDVLPPELRQELPFDSYAETRLLAAQ